MRLNTKRTLYRAAYKRMYLLLTKRGASGYMCYNGQQNHRNNSGNMEIKVMKSFLNRKFPGLAKNMEPKIMKSFLCRKFSGLAKRLSFFQQEQSTSDDINYNKIDAADFQKICDFLEQHANNFDYASNFLKRTDAKENITLDPTSDSPHGESKVNGVVFRNFKIEGDVEIEFLPLERMEFVNSVFSDNVKISAKGGNFTHVSFDGNKFSGDFDLQVNNVHFVFIQNNSISHKMDMSFIFPSLPDDSDCPETKHVPIGTRPIELFMKFSKNEIEHLNICDISDPSDWHRQEYPLENIRFAGDNHIGTLDINTKHTALTSYEQLKADVNKISFNASDKIGFSTPETDPTSDEDNKDPLIYGGFFSLLEVQSSKQHDPVNEKMYKRKSRYFYRKFSHHWEDRFIFIWTNWFSKDGTSWVYPLFWLTVTEASLAIIAYRFLVEWSPHYSWEESWRVFLTLFTWFMNPASLLPLPTPPLDPKDIAESWLLYVLFLFQKASVAVFYYEIVKVMRRFSKSIK